jgi:hypothetical protein
MVELMIEAALECPTKFIAAMDKKLGVPKFSISNGGIIVATMVSSTTKWPDAKSNAMKFIGELVVKTDELYQDYFGPDEFLVVDRSACMAVHPAMQRFAASTA